MRVDFFHSSFNRCSSVVHMLHTPFTPLCPSNSTTAWGCQVCRCLCSVFSENIQNNRRRRRRRKTQGRGWRDWRRGGAARWGITQGTARKEKGQEHGKVVAEVQLLCTALHWLCFEPSRKKPTLACSSRCGPIDSTLVLSNSHLIDLVHEAPCVTSYSGQPYSKC